MDSSARTLPSGGSVLAALVLALGLAACAAAPPPAPPRALSPGEQCLADLGAHGVRYELAAVPTSTGPCAVVNPVKVASAGVAWNQPAVMSCALADRVDRFFTEAVEPLARRHLGTGIARMDNFGAYSCRREVGQAGRWSEHAAGRAIDVSGFVTADGSRVTVEQDWNRPGPKREFLHAVASRACDYFNVVLSPDSDRYHYNHLHLDIGPWRLCQTRAKTPAARSVSSTIDSGASP
ncbi:MAG TPA: extensin family protein [Stellaceae bacterium]|nr:extensin family protein [Stellaceae bacterium]